MNDGLWKILSVDHLPLLTLQLNVPHGSPHVEVLPCLEERAVDDSDKRGLIQVEECLVGTEMDVAMPNKGALLGNVYDEIPDDADEHAYNALEKAYNAAFTISPTEKLERDRKIRYWIIEGRKKAIFAVKKRNALETIAAYKAQLHQQRNLRLREQRNTVFNYDGPSAEEIWKTAVVSSVSERAMAMSTHRRHREKALRDLAELCQEANSKRLTMSAFNRSCVIKSEASTPQNGKNFKDKLISVSQQRNMLSDNLKMVTFLVNEADNYMQMLFGNRAVATMDAKEQFYSLTLTFNEVVRMADITASALFNHREAQLAEFDAEWAHWHKRYIKQARKKIILPNVDITSSPQTVVEVLNPFQGPNGFKKWSCLTAPSTNEAEIDLSAIQAIMDLPDISNDAVDQMKKFYTRGINGILLYDSTRNNRSIRHILALLTDLAFRDNKWGPHLIAASSSELPLWEAALESLCPQLRVLTYWGSDEDRATLRSYWSDDSVRSKDAPFHVVLTTFRVVVADSEHWHSLQWQLTVYDRPLPAYHSLWSKLLSIRCRQRWLLCPENTNTDLRLILHFAAPDLFDSKQKTLAWGAASLDAVVLKQLIAIVKNVAIALDNEATFVDSAATTSALCASVHSVLTKMDASPVSENVLSTPLVSTDTRHLTRFKKNHHSLKFSIEAKNNLLKRAKLPVQSFETSTPAAAPTTSTAIACKHCAKTFMTSSGLLKHTKSDHAPPGTWTCRKCGHDCVTMALRNAHERQEHDETIGPSNKPSQPLPPISVASAAASDVATPPATTPVAQKKRNRSSTSRSKKRVTRCGKCSGCLAGDCMECGHCQDMKKYGGPGLRKQSCKNRKCTNPQVLPTSSMPETSVLDDDDDQDGISGLKMDMQDEDQFMDSHSDSDQSINNDSDDEIVEEYFEEGEYDENAKLSKKILKRRGKSSINSRTRVMRCGVCVGCLAPDCMKCRHCLDMKKYGGPGLRKQSCKSRKCVTPKVVMLNQGMEGEEECLLLGDEYPKTLHWQSMKNITMVVTPEWERDTILDLGSGLALQYLQQRQLDRHLLFPCSLCGTKFATAALTDLHQNVVHKKLVDLPRWQREFAKFMLKPAVQYFLLSSAIKRKKSIDFEPTGYAKLVGPGLCYYMLQPQITLGRLSSKWRDRYQELRINFTRGLAGGNVDCHLGDDLTISAEHASIRWDVQRQHFVIKCLSFVTPISVNGRELTMASAPMGLRSRDLIQIGAFYFFFLLPTGNTPTSTLPTGPATDSSCRQLLPRPEVLAWLDSKRRRKRDRQGDNLPAKKQMRFE
ncbi:hypothetical protein THRCLA_06482 [Thraustotheca clavata]|uniref:Chromatin-remodeling ATPase INO80 n=1 Tax=Thraustotheca clavata TaxID=74557 RepID=A0A1V9ZNF5_9STRA|nr:hypothetical protein THRCLA_06482 [Thraustotheca clavata]